MIRDFLLLLGALLGGALTGALIAHAVNVIEEQRSWNRHVRDVFDVLEDDR